MFLRPRLSYTGRLLTRRHASSSFYKPPTTRVKRQKTKEEKEREQFEADLKSPHILLRWGAKFRTKEFQKNMTKWYILAYVVFAILASKFVKGVYDKDKELEKIQKKMTDHLDNEYDRLRLKQLTGHARRRDELKLEEYEKLKESGVESFDGITVDGISQNDSNKSILPARDTTPFYDGKAEEYDSDIDFEEKVIMMGRKRKWLMRHCSGDVLEVSCGTGRNIKYLDMEKIHSLTLLDSSGKMMEVAHKKFREEFPSYKNVAFVVGRAEDLVKLASNSDGKDQLIVEDIDKNRIDVTDDKTKIKYDTIVEAFGLCSHEDPVKALKNFATLLKPGGRIVLLEHGRGTFDMVNKILDKRAEHRLKTWGCRWNLDIGELLDDSGLEIIEENRSHLGTTWSIVAKKKEDAKKPDEIGFVEKYFSYGIRKKLESLAEEEEKEKFLAFAREKAKKERERQQNEQKDLTDESKK